MITCKDFLAELNQYLDNECCADLREELEEHLKECPNCWVVCDTTKKTIEIYQGMDPHPIDQDVHERLMGVLRKKCSKPESH